MTPVLRGLMAALVLVLALGACNGSACPSALLTGRLEVVDEVLVVRDASGRPWSVRWPAGIEARPGPPPVLVDRLGTVVAVPGDVVAIGGGTNADDSAWLGCGHFERVVEDAASIDRGRPADKAVPRRTEPDHTGVHRT